MGSRHYTKKEKAQAILALKAEDGNKSKVARMDGMPSRKTLRKWWNNREKILADYEKIKKLEEAEQEDEEAETLPDKEKDSILDNAEIGEDYNLVKNYLADQFGQITEEAAKIALRKIQQADPKDAMWIASTGLDKLMKLKGEPDQVIEVRNVILHKFVMKMKEAVHENIISRDQADALAQKFEEIEEAEYEEL